MTTKRRRPLDWNRIALTYLAVAAVLVVTTLLALTGTSTGSGAGAIEPGSSMTEQGPIPTRPDAAPFGAPRHLRTWTI